VDPGLLMWLLRHGGVAADELNGVLESCSGLRGLSGTSGDLRAVLAGRYAGDPDCVLAFDVFIHQLCREIAGMTAATGGLDVLVMTGGIAEHARWSVPRWRPVWRSSACASPRRPTSAPLVTPTSARPVPRCGPSW
jgi:acetate kinase